jgi:DNA-directed RNA polymerase III subunit RPC6
MAEAEAVKLDVLKEALYDAVQGYGDDKRLFTQADLLALDILPDPHDVLLLAKLVGVLVRERLFVAVNDTRVGLAWRFRSRQDAEKLVLPMSMPVLVVWIGKGKSRLT